MMLIKFLKLFLPGPSLEDLFNLCGRRLSLRCVCLLAEQILSRVEYLHSSEIRMKKDINRNVSRVGNKPYDRFVLKIYQSVRSCRKRHGFHTAVLTSRFGSFCGSFDLWKYVYINRIRTPFSKSAPSQCPGPRGPARAGFREAR
jgi:hypothetical protein